MFVIKTYFEKAWGMGYAQMPNFNNFKLIKLGMENKNKQLISRLHLKFLDNLRGFVALYVVINHIYLAAFPVSQIPVIHPLLTQGECAVVFFIVLSGFCLTIPILNLEHQQLTYGLFDYFKRRFLRIVPPYYAAILYTLILIKLIPWLQETTDLRWNIIFPAFSYENILAHLLLIHNLNPKWIYTINYPMWSLAVEWQIYFIFPILLIIRKNLGLALTIILTFIVCVVSPFLLKTLVWHFALMTFFGFIFCFMLGMISAEICFSQSQSFVCVLKNIRWDLITFLLFSLCCCLVIANIKLTGYFNYLVGLAISSLFIWLTKLLSAGKHLSIFKFLDSSFPVDLGKISYSLYLSHAPILALLNISLLKLNVGGTTRFVFLMLNGIPICLAIAYLFFLVFERPIVYQHTKS